MNLVVPPLLCPNISEWKMRLVDSSVVSPLSSTAILRCRCVDFGKSSSQPLCPSGAEVMGRITEVHQRGLQKVKITYRLV